MATKLNSLKRNNLSLVGRITFIKSVIKAFPLYPMMTNKLPKKCVDEIQSLERKFFWGDTDEKNKMHAIAWNNVTRSKHFGGMGLRDLCTLNNVCLMKLGWKLYRNVDDLL